MNNPDETTWDNTDGFFTGLPFDVATMFDGGTPEDTPEDTALSQMALGQRRDFQRLQEIVKVIDDGIMGSPANERRQKWASKIEDAVNSDALMDISLRQAKAMLGLNTIESLLNLDLVARAGALYVHGFLVGVKYGQQFTPLTATA